MGTEKNIDTGQINFSEVHPPSALSALKKVIAPGGKGLFASAGKLYQYAIFGRDSAESAETLLDYYPEIAQEVILTLASLQGTEDNPKSEEEPGRIHHEHRNIYVDGEKVPPYLQKNIKKDSRKWGGTGESYTYYGSVDATPLYIRLVTHYCQKYGPNILDSIYINKDGKSATVRESVVQALGWIERKINSSDLGLVEYKKANPRGIENQVWKDSFTSFIHINGNLANHTRPIAAIEVQGLSYDALSTAAILLEKEAPNDTLKWRKLASELQASTLANFWMLDEGFFAVGIDRDPKGLPRQIKVPSSDPSLLLNTSIFDSLHENTRQFFLSSLVRMLYGPEFLTDAGIRCRSVRFHDLVGFSDYSGSGTVWVKETYVVARGLRRQHFYNLSEQLSNRILNTTNLTGSEIEFIYVDPYNRVNYDPYQIKTPPAIIPTPIYGTNIPEKDHIWTIAALIDIKYRRGKNLLEQEITTSPPLTWQQNLEEELLVKAPNIKAHKHHREIIAAFPKNYAFVIDVETGKKIEQQYRTFTT